MATHRADRLRRAHLRDVSSPDSRRRVVAVYRVSTEGQAESGLGIAAQQQAVREWVTRNGAELVFEFTDQASGRVPADGRPGLRKAIQLVEEGEADSVIVNKLDRLARNARDALGVIERVPVIVTERQIDTGSTLGKFFITMLAAVAELEANQIADRTEAALATKRREGKRASRFAPVGWKFAKDGSIVRHDDGALELILKLRKERVGFRRIKARLDQEKYRTGDGRPYGIEGIRALASGKWKDVEWLK